MNQGSVRQSVRFSSISPRPAHQESLACRGATVKRRGRSRQRTGKPEPRPRILVIEDDPYAREALALLLDYYGYEVVVASNGADGVELVTEATPDLIVTDWRMPGLSGLALCIALRKRHGTIPIIVVTSADEVFNHDQPVNARLRKPIDPPLLNRIITEELRTQRRGPDSGNE